MGNVETLIADVQSSSNKEGRRHSFESQLDTDVSLVYRPWLSWRLNRELLKGAAAFEIVSDLQLLSALSLQRLVNLHLFTSVTSLPESLRSVYKSIMADPSYRAAQPGEFFCPAGGTWYVTKHQPRANTILRDIQTV